MKRFVLPVLALLVLGSASALGQSSPTVLATQEAVQRRNGIADTLRRVGQPGVNFSAQCTATEAVRITPAFDYSMSPRYTRSERTGFPLLPVRGCVKPSSCACSIWRGAV